MTLEEGAVVHQDGSVGPSMAKIIVEECQPRIAHVPAWVRLKIALPTEIVAVRKGAEIVDLKM